MTQQIVVPVVVPVVVVVPVEVVVPMEVVVVVPVEESKFSFGLCELYNNKLHGYIPGESDPHINGHYLVIYTENDNELVELHRRKYKELILDPQYQYQCQINNNCVVVQIHGFEHDLIRNYYNIVCNIDNYIKPEIFQKIYLSGNECCAILKTFWIRIIQRTWKRIFRLHKVTGSILTVRGMLMSV